MSIGPTCRCWVDDQFGDLILAMQDGRVTNRIMQQGILHSATDKKVPQLSRLNWEGLDNRIRSRYILSWMTGSPPWNTLPAQDETSNSPLRITLELREANVLESHREHGSCLQIRGFRLWCTWHNQSWRNNPVEWEGSSNREWCECILLFPRVMVPCLDWSTAWANLWRVASAILVCSTRDHEPTAQRERGLWRHGQRGCQFQARQASSGQG